MGVLVSPSLLSCDFANLASDIKKVEDAGCDCLHVDVMDGHFVPNITIGPVIVDAIKKSASTPLDVHLMIENPERYVEPFVKAGSDWITVHLEAVKDPIETLKFIKSFGKKAGLSISPDTPVDKLYEFIPYLDLALIMTVYPGFGGQKLIPSCAAKIKPLNDARKGNEFILAIDGGVTADNAAGLIADGADLLVAGTAVFKAEDPKKAISLIKGE